MVHFYFVENPSSRMADAFFDNFDSEFLSSNVVDACSDGSIRAGSENFICRSVKIFKLRGRDGFVPLLLSRSTLALILLPTGFNA